MNQEKIDSLTEGLAKALALVDAVGSAVRQGFCYSLTQRAAQRTVGQIEALLTALQDDWGRDENWRAG
jgi:hypothetical protein